MRKRGAFQSGRGTLKNKMYREIEKNTSKIIKQSLYERNTLSSHKKKKKKSRVKKKVQTGKYHVAERQNEPRKIGNAIFFLPGTLAEEKCYKNNPRKQNNNDANNQASEAVEQSRAINHAGGQADRRASKQAGKSKTDDGQRGGRSGRMSYAEYTVPSQGV